MNLAEVAIRGKTVTLVFAVILLVGGLMSYMGLGRLEDPEFTIKNALVITPYPGASALEVEEEVSDVIELAAQSLGPTRTVQSRSTPGLSIVDVEIKRRYGKAELPQIWDELRRKVNDAQRNLPPGAGPSLVNDDFGDVFGIFAAISGDEYTYAELKDFAEQMRKELLLVPDVAKIELYGIQQEAVFVEMSRDKMAQFGVPPDAIYAALREKNLATDGGRVHAGVEHVTVRPTGGFSTVDQFRSLLISEPGSDVLVRLGDVASIRRGYLDPPGSMLRIDGTRAIGVAISTVSGGNVVTMGQALQKRVQELTYMRPLGVNVDTIAVQSEAVVQAIDGFVVNLAEAVAIVIVVLLLFMGLRSGLIIGGVLLLTISGTFILMSIYDIALERISLGALVIALGMLVDNAIVVTDGALINMQRGIAPKEAASRVVKQTATPLLMATVVAILSFAAIGTSQDSTGEYCGSLYSVLWMSLSLSWVTAVTITPLFCVMFLKVPDQKDGGESDPYATPFYRGYKGLLRVCMRQRWVSVAVLLAITLGAVVAFGGVNKSFFPDSTRPQFLVDYWMPRGTHLEDTRAQVERLEQHMLEQEGVTQVATVVGQGAPRFLLTYAPEKTDSGYAQFLVGVDAYERIDPLMAKLQSDMETQFPEGQGNVKKFLLGPGEGGKIQVRIRGDDPNTLRGIATQIETVMQEDGNARGIRGDWRHRVKVVRPVLLEEPARLNGIERHDVARTVAAGFEGTRVGVYREGDELLPILARAPEIEREDIAELAKLQIWSPIGHRWIPLGQVVSGFETVFEDDVVWRYNRRRTITVHCDQRTGNASTLLARLQPQIAAIELPQGYEIEYGGEYESSQDAQGALIPPIKLFALMMIITVIVLFNAIRQPLVIWLCVPLSFIGVTIGLLATDQPFGFMALLGLLSLVGMLIKNAIVLIDEIDLQIKEGKDPFDAILDSATSRVRPVSMAALTTMLGMIPLFTDAFFIAMAVTIVFGLGFATILTLVVVPIFYAIFFRIHAPR